MLTYLESVELHVGVPVSKTLDQTLDRLLGAVLVGRDPVADLHDGAPVLRCEVLIRRLGCTRGATPSISIYLDGATGSILGSYWGKHTDGLIVRPWSCRPKHDGQAGEVVGTSLPRSWTDWSRRLAALWNGVYQVRVIASSDSSSNKQVD